MTSVRRLRQRRRRWRWRGKINFSHTFICKLYTRTLYSVHTHTSGICAPTYTYRHGHVKYTRPAVNPNLNILSVVCSFALRTPTLFTHCTIKHISRECFAFVCLCANVCVYVCVCCACRVHFSWSTRPLSAAYCALELLRVTRRTLRGPRAWHDLWKYVYLTLPNVWAEHTRSAHMLSTSQDQLTCRQLCINQQHT